jgi:hypothetical protein
MKRWYNAKWTTEGQLDVRLEINMTFHQQHLEISPANIQFDTRSFVINLLASKFKFMTFYTATVIWKYASLFLFIAVYNEERFHKQCFIISVRNMLLEKLNKISRGWNQIKYVSFLFMLMLIGEGINSIKKTPEVYNMTLRKLAWKQEHW